MTPLKPFQSIYRWKHFHELMFCLAVWCGILVLYLRTRMPVEYFLDGGWAEYLRGVHYIWHSRPDVWYNDWRNPLHSILIGLWANGLTSSYYQAAFDLNLIYSIITLCSVAVTARVLASRSAGILSMVALLSMPYFIQSAHWSSIYPALTAATSAAIAMGVCACRRSSILLAAGTGLAAGAACSFDQRGLIVVVMGFLLVSGAIRRGHLRRYAVMMGLFILGSGSMMQVDPWIKTSLNLPYRSLEQQVTMQREHLRPGPDESLATPRSSNPCREMPAGVPTLGGLLHPCSRLTLRMNFSMLIPRSLPGWDSPYGHGSLAFPAALLGLLFGCTLLPYRGRLRNGWMSLVIFAIPAGSFAVGAAWVDYFHRYMLLNALPVSVLIPVASARLFDYLGRRGYGSNPAIPRALGGIVAALLLMIWWPAPLRLGEKMSPLYFSGPGNGESKEPSHITLFRLAHWAQSAILPRHKITACTSPPGKLLMPLAVDNETARQLSRECLDFIKNPANEYDVNWLIINDVPGDPMGQLDASLFSRRAILGHGWSEDNAWKEGAAHLATHRYHVYRYLNVEPVAPLPRAPAEL